MEDRREAVFLFTRDWRAFRRVGEADRRLMRRWHPSLRGAERRSNSCRRMQTMDCFGPAGLAMTTPDPEGLAGDRLVRPVRLFGVMQAGLGNLPPSLPPACRRRGSCRAHVGPARTAVKRDGMQRSNEMASRTRAPAGRRPAGLRRTVTPVTDARRRFLLRQGAGRVELDWRRKRAKSASRFLLQ
jgi:hypothetical protein